MNETLTYRSHTIELELIEVRPQHFHWHYAIDGTYRNKSDEVLQPVHMARANALKMAHGHINALEVVRMSRHELGALAAWYGGTPNRDRVRRSDLVNAHHTSTGT